MGAELEPPTAPVFFLHLAQWQHRRRSANYSITDWTQKELPLFWLDCPRRQPMWRGLAVCETFKFSGGKKSTESLKRREPSSGQLTADRGSTFLAHFLSSLLPPSLGVKLRKNIIAVLVSQFDLTEITWQYMSDPRGRFSSSWLSTDITDTGKTQGKCQLCRLFVCFRFSLSHCISYWTVLSIKLICVTIL